MSNYKWAEREAQYAIKRAEQLAKDNGEPEAAELDRTIYSNALAAFKELEGQGHSGLSISLVYQILGHFVHGEPLTPVDDKEEEWILQREWGANKRGKVYVHSRMRGLYRHIYSDGRRDYNDVDRVLCQDENGHMWSNGFFTRLINELYPIEFPYAREKIVLVVYDYLTDRKNGDFDTLHWVSMIRNNDEAVPIHRYFKEGGPAGWVEIDDVEFNNRLTRHTIREWRESKKPIELHTATSNAEEAMMKPHPLQESIYETEDSNEQTN